MYVNAKVIPVETLLERAREDKGEKWRRGIQA
jgi:hypothetical protein